MSKYPLWLTNKCVHVPKSSGASLLSSASGAPSLFSKLKTKTTFSDEILWSRLRWPSDDDHIPNLVDLFAT